MLDLDAARAARADADRQPLPITLGGKTFHAIRPVKLAVVVAVGEVQDGDLRGFRKAIAGLFGEDQVDAVLDAGLEFDDLPAILQALLGGDEGESPASTG